MLFSQKHLNVLEKFRGGKCMVHKTNKFCSAMNYIINGSGGAVSLADNPPALRRWLVVCPKVATMIVENEDDETRSH